MILKSTPSFPNGSFKELLLLFFPVFLITLSSSVLFFLEKLFFSYLAPEAMEAAINVTYVCRIFQLPCVLLAMMAQVCVGRLYGARQLETIGSVIWQFIWFSLLSIFLTLPLGLLYGKLYFQRTDLAHLAIPYFNFILFLNFLYPLGAALSCFHLGRGRTRLIVSARLISELLTITIAYTLIFGKFGMPKMGLMGSAIGILIGQGSLCIFLFATFLRPAYARLYGSWNWHFQPKLFWENIQPGLLRGLSAIINTLSWSSTAHLMTAKGGHHCLALSMGGSLFLFLSCLGDALCQTMTTIFSQILGSKQYHLLRQTFRSGVILSISLKFIIGVLLIFLSTPLFHLFFPDSFLNESSVRNIFIGVWLCSLGYMLIFVPISYILAVKDTKFSLLMGTFAWINGFLLLYLAIEKVGIAPDQFWIVASLTHFSSIALYVWRVRKLRERLVENLNVVA